MELNWNYDQGETPLDEDEKEGLKLKNLLTKADLDLAEQKSIELAILWSLGLKITAEKLLTEAFIMKVHKQMFAKVWDWSGSYRKTDKNIGVDKWSIVTYLKYLIDDTKYWITNAIFEPDEIAIRFKHRLVSIHCFPNGNGRHSRLMADILISQVFKLDVFTWGSKANDTPELQRSKYLIALREADKGNYNPLVIFARS